MCYVVSVLDKAAPSGRSGQPAYAEDDVERLA